MSMINASNSRISRANANLRCFACLSIDRDLKPLKQMTLMAVVCPEIFLNATITTHYLICWECQAIVLKIKEFKAKVVKAQTLLKRTVHVGSIFSQGLSNLKLTGIESITIPPNIAVVPMVIDEPAPFVGAKSSVKMEETAVEVKKEKTDYYDDYDELIQLTSYHQISSGESTDTASETDMAVPDCDLCSSTYPVRNEFIHKKIETEVNFNTPVKEVINTFQHPKFTINMKLPKAYINTPQESLTPRGIKEQVKVTVGVPNIGVLKVDVPEIAVPKKDVPKKAVPKKAVPKKAVPKKAVPKKAVPKKTIPKKRVPKKRVSKKRVSKKGVSKKGVSKKGVSKKRVSKTSVSKVDVSNACDPKKGLSDIGVSNMAVPNMPVSNMAVPNMPVSNMAVPNVVQDVSEELKLGLYGFEEIQVKCKLVNRYEMNLFREGKRNHHIFKAARYKCDKCLEKFNTQENLDVHNKKHVGEQGDCVCDICEQKFPEHSMRDLHYKSHFIIYECITCAWQSNDRINISEHIRRKHQISEFHCNKCDEVFKTYKEQLKHKLREHYPRPTCNECGKTYSCRRALRDHVAIHSGEIIECTVCKKKIKKSRYRAHGRYHNPNNEDLDAVYCVTCCNYYKNKASYTTHLKLSLKHNPIEKLGLKCDHCGKCFRSKSTLKDHIEIEHTLNPEVTCDICKKEFKSKKRLIRHIGLIHEGKKRKLVLMCEICGKSYTDKHSLDHHRNAHLGLRPFKCQDCGDTFSYSASLYTHRKLVHKVKKKSETEKAEKEEQEKTEKEGREEDESK